MDAATSGVGDFIETSKRIARRLPTMVENRIELLMVEMQGERVRLLGAIVTALGIAAFGLLAGITLTAAIVVLLWHYSPLAVLLMLTGVHGGAAFCLYRKLSGMLRDWQSLPATLDQLRKDSACLEKSLT